MAIGLNCVPLVTGIMTMLWRGQLRAIQSGTKHQALHKKKQLGAGAMVRWCFWMWTMDANKHIKGRCHLPYDRAISYGEKYGWADMYNETEGLATLFTIDVRNMERLPAYIEPWLTEL